MKDKDELYSPEESARRRDEVIRRMANTPPQPKANHRPKRKRKAVADRVAGKDRAAHEV
jgi:hypothetical protein